MMLPNKLRGEVTAQIGTLDLVLAIDMDGLSRLAAATGYPSLKELYGRLAGSEPYTTFAALDLFTVRGTVNGKALKKDDAVAQAKARLDMNALVELQGPMLALLACLTREEKKESPQGNGRSARSR